VQRVEEPCALSHLSQLVQSDVDPADLGELHVAPGIHEGAGRRARDEAPAGSLDGLLRERVPPAGIEGHHASSNSVDHSV
jgi:hypothetical protein